MTITQNLVVLSNWLGSLSRTFLNFRSTNSKVFEFEQTWLRACVLKTYSENKDIFAQKSSTCKRNTTGFVKEKFLCFLHKHVTSADIWMNSYFRTKNSKQTNKWWKNPTLFQIKNPLLSPCLLTALSIVQVIKQVLCNKTDCLKTFFWKLK